MRLRSAITAWQHSIRMMLDLRRHLRVHGIALLRVVVQTWQTIVFGLVMPNSGASTPPSATSGMYSSVAVAKNPGSSCMRRPTNAAREAKRHSTLGASARGRESRQVSSTHSSSGALSAHEHYISKPGTSSPALAIAKQHLQKTADAARQRTEGRRSERILGDSRELSAGADPSRGRHSSVQERHSRINISNLMQVQSDEPFIGSARRSSSTVRGSR